ncbi:aldo/keto reductase [Membranihabitans maritimus]|uniref:aldo/keto reductase n=1 Tax=Membranihabitans maritimus TaxID=2904244 RepID=UPI001F3A20E4|nr:aldo/keto reductase [Membranihabitans maritimus]
MKISKLTLGTVQLGLDYSIHNPKPTLEESKSILRTAFDLGINTLDTAREYGSSEEVIGSFLEEGLNPMVVTKFKVNPSHLKNPGTAFNEAFDSISRSLKMLKLDKIPILLFHKGPDHSLEDTCKVIPGILRKLKDLDLIEKGGVSVFEPEEIKELMEYEDIQAFQVPVNIFDHRLMKSGVLEYLDSSGRIVFARSIFLKGLFFNSERQLKGIFEEAVPYIRKLQEIVSRTNLSVAEMAFLFVRDIPGITSLVVGADNVQQIEQNSKLMNKAALKPGLREEIYESFASVPKKVITPHIWNI